MKCPTCGGHVNDADFNVLSQVNLSPQQKIILDRILVSHPRTVRTVALVSALYGGEADGGPDDAENVVRVQIVNTNKVLASYGWRIISLNHRYRLVQEGSDDFIRITKIDGRVTTKSWARDEIEMLTILYSDGTTPRNMVPLLKRTQNAISGKIHRMKLDGEIV